MRTHRAIIAGLAALGLSLAAGPAAQASLDYGPVESIGAGELSFPLGVAVNEASGNIYVGNLVDSKVVKEYNSVGGYVTTFGRETDIYTGTAVDPVNENVYAINGQVIETYSASGQFVSEFSIEGSANLFGTAAVQIASDTEGNVYLPNAPNNEVQEFNHRGEVLHVFTGSGAEALKEPTGVAVSSAGDVFVADDGNGRVEEFDPTGAFVMALGTGVNQTTGGSVCTAASGDTCGPGSDGSQAVALDASGDIFVGENSGSGFHVVLYNSTGEKLSDFGLGTIGTSELGTINSLAVGPAGQVYVVDGGNNLVWVYARQSKPSLLNESSSAVTQTSATLDAKLAPNDADTTYQFEYGTTTAYGTSIPVPDGNIGNGVSSPATVSVGEELAGLQPGTTYHYRVLATNSVGQTVGPDQTFTTPPLQPPVVSTGQATGVAQNTATLTGAIDTQGFGTTYEFDIGVDTSYGTRIFGYAGTEPGTQTYAIPLQGLTAGATYHYRILATNTFGTTYGADETFTTASYPSSVLTGPATPPLLATPVLATANSTSRGSAPANASALKPGARVARHHGDGKSGRAAGRHGLKRTAGGTDHARKANGRGK